MLWGQEQTALQICGQEHRDYTLASVHLRSVVRYQHKWNGL